MNSRFSLIALSIVIAVLSLALGITVVGATASSLSGEASAIEAGVDLRDGMGSHLLAYQRPNISQDEPLSLTEPISIYLPLLSTVGYIDKEAERDALMALYNSTNGDAWFINTGWGTDSLLCDWYGVTCDEYGHVEILNLDQNGMTGTLPSEIGNLPMLTVLRLTGTIICYGTKTSHYCEHYQLSGPIPPEIGNLQNLQELNLDDNTLLFLPPEIGNLSNLQVLTLGSNQLTSLPPELGNLANLQWLYLSYNQLTFLPPELGNLPILQELDLSYNKLSGPTPAFLSNLGNLSALYLAGNPLSCWETQEALDWALSLDVYVGSTCFFP